MLKYEGNVGLECGLILYHNLLLKKTVLCFSYLNNTSSSKLNSNHLNKFSVTYHISVQYPMKYNIIGYAKISPCENGPTYDFHF